MFHTPVTSRLIRLAWTIRYLKARQVRSLAYRRVASAIERYGYADSAAGPGHSTCAWSSRGENVAPCGHGNTLESVRHGSLSLLNRRETVGFPPSWDVSHLPTLWQYNLHYFDWLWILDFDAGREAVTDWIRAYPNGRDRVGWESYPMSLRLVNWCSFFFGRFRDRTESDREFCRMLWGSLHTQCEWLCRHLETHLLNNHYLENAAALVLLGTSFDGRSPRKWFGQGMHILSDQIEEQILPDGVHFELSPMYHCRILDVLIVLMETQATEVRSLLAEPVRRMAQALGKLCHPDGQIALFSDSALGVYHDPACLLQQSQRYLPPMPSAGDEYGCFALPDAGYYGWRGSDGTYMVADFGRIGPDYSPGHGHADQFSFELSFNGHRVITDTGVRDYDSSDTRRYCRSTAAHNTVEVDGQDQCELWGAFRVARRGYPREVAWDSRPRGFTLSGWHDGYRRLAGKPVHIRYMEWDASAGLTVRDRVVAHRPVRSVSRLHLHPTCRIVDAESRCIRVSCPAGMVRIQADTDIQMRETPYFERFYETQTRPCLCMSGEGCCIEQQFKISMEKAL
ncbi:MAG: alginate lyase family protein [Phycisphaerales bacterium]